VCRIRKGDFRIQFWREFWIRILLHRYFRIRFQIQVKIKPFLPSQRKKFIRDPCWIRIRLWIRNLNCRSGSEIWIADPDPKFELQIWIWHTYNYTIALRWKIWNDLKKYNWTVLRIRIPQIREFLTVLRIRIGSGFNQVLGSGSGIRIRIRIQGQESEEEKNVNI